MKKVYFFATCLGNIAYANTSVSAVKLLRKAGLEVIYKKNQTCCAQPSYNSGYFEESKKIILANIKLFNDLDVDIVVPSGSCTGMMRMDYKELFQDTPYMDEVHAFSNRVYEVSEYLLKENISLTDKGEPIKVTWHSNCHALRVAKTITANKKLLSALSNVELVELAHEAECCGFGGTFAVKRPRVSEAMVASKVADIISRGASAMILADYGCEINIVGYMKAHGFDLPVMHLYDFINKRIGE